jgi:uncharacterized protein
MTQNEFDSSRQTHEAAAVKATYAAINRNDIAAAVSALDPEVEWIEPPDYPGGGGTYRGPAQAMAHISKGRDTWAEGSCEVERLIFSGDKVIAFIHVRVRLKDHAEWIDGRIADVHTFRNGKVIQVRSFGTSQAAVEWAGANISDGEATP